MTLIAYTVAVREKGKTGAFKYLEFDGATLRLNETAQRSKPLSRDDAELAKRLLIADAADLGRPIECRIMRLVGSAA